MAILDLLSTEKAIRANLLIHLYIARICEKYQRSCKQIYAASLLQATIINFANEEELQLKAPKRFHISDQLGDKIDRWSNIPTLPIQLKWYNHFSTCWMTYVFLKNILPLKKLIGNTFNLALPAHCYIPGRFVLTQQYIAEASVAWTFWHLAWRLYHGIRRRHFHLNLLMFLFQKRSDIEMISKNLHHPTLIGNRGCFVRSIMCYSFQKLGFKKVYRIRSHRTLDMYDYLTKYHAKIAVTALIIMTLSVCLVFPYIALNVFLDKNYVARYPGCFSNLDELNRLNQLSDWSITLLNGHRMSAILFDVIENFVIWFDTGTAAVGVTALVYMISHDILIYEEHLARKLDELNLKLKLETLQLDRLTRFSVPDLHGAQQSEQWANNKSTLRLDSFVEEIQMELKDFFEQIIHINEIVSDAFSHGLIIWFTSLVVIAYIDAETSVIFQIRVLQVFTFFAITFITSYLIILPLKTLKMYRVICSLMANDRSRHREKFIGILQYYRPINRSTYKIFHMIPLEGTTYLTILGYSLSCLIIIQNLLKR